MTAKKKGRIVPTTDHCISRQAWGDGECECGGTPESK